MNAIGKVIIILEERVFQKRPSIFQYPRERKSEEKRIEELEQLISKRR